MNDDEAFIRAIVDAPGDDAPRLVYADWLDERGDSRGAYLRAEVKWAMDPTPDVFNDLELELRNHDPVWVAKISRPPLGICCEHLGLSSPDGGSDPEDVEAAETELGLLFPPHLRALLLNYRLGHLFGGPFVFFDGDDAQNIAVDAFVCLTDSDWEEEQVSLELIDRTEWLRDEYQLDPEYLFLAATLNENEFVVSCREDEFGSVHITDRYFMQSEPGTGVQLFAGSIGEFLRRLEPRTWPLTKTNSDDSDQ